jgi:excisionase family DNA binding protein
MDESSRKMAGASDARGGGGRTPRRLGEGKLCYTVPEAAELLRVSRNQGYELVRQGVIPVIIIGSRIRVPIVRFHEKFGNFPENDANS